LSIADFRDEKATSFTSAQAFFDDNGETCVRDEELSSHTRPTSECDTDLYEGAVTVHSSLRWSPGGRNFQRPSSEGGAGATHERRPWVSLSMLLCRRVTRRRPPAQRANRRPEEGRRADRRGLGLVVRNAVAAASVAVAAAVDLAIVSALSLIANSLQVRGLCAELLEVAVQSAAQASG
jgi:hypothetical protein